MNVGVLLGCGPGRRDSAHTIAWTRDVDPLTLLTERSNCVVPDNAERVASGLRTAGA